MKQVNYFKLKSGDKIYFYDEVLLNTYIDIVGECHEFRIVRVVSSIPRNIVESAKMVVEWQEEIEMAPTYPQLFVKREDIEFLGYVMIDMDGAKQ